MSDVLVMVEHRRGTLRDVSLEAIGVGQMLAEEGTAVGVIGGPEDGFLDRLDREGVSHIYTVPGSVEFTQQQARRGTQRLIEQLSLRYVVIPHTADGIAYAPAVAIDVDWPLIADIIQLDDQTFVRELYGGRVTTSIEPTGPAIVTVRPGGWSRPKLKPGATVESVAMPDKIEDGPTTTGYQDIQPDDIDITGAKLAIGIGGGIDEQATVEQIKELARLTGGTVVGTETTIAAGWLSRARHVGRFGHSIAPTTYLAIGIEGTDSHVTGIRRADTIIAINKDPDAPMVALADYGIIGDISEIIPTMIEQLRA